MSLAVKQELFVDDRIMRDKYASRTDVLDKVKSLSLLPDDKHMTTKMVADYYEVEKSTLDVLVMRHRSEIEADGLLFLSGSLLKTYKSTHLQDVSELKRVPKLTLFTRRAILRIGMLLRDSEVAKQVRTYLLNVEEQATQQQKEIAIRGSSWAGSDLKLYSIIENEVLKNNGTLTSACRIASKELNRSVGACMTRYSSYIKHEIQNIDLIKRIEGNKKRNTHLRLVENTPNQNVFIEEVTQQIGDIYSFMQKAQLENTQHLIDKIKRLESERDEYKEKYERSNRSRIRKHKELRSLQSVIKSAVEVKVNDEHKNTFRMDVNGNLERVTSSREDKQ